MSTPLVSITSAFHNEEKYLPDLIRCILAQTFTDWELILVDDGSTDRSLEIAQSVKDPRIRVYSNGRNLGRSASLNRLTQWARGRYIARQDADDLCSPHRIEQQVAFMESHPDVDAVGTGVCFLSKTDDPLGEWRPPVSHTEITANAARLLHILHGTILAKKRWFETHPYNEHLPISVDFHLLFHAARDSIFANVPDPLYYYRLDQSFNLRKQFVARLTNARFLFQAFWNEGRRLEALAQAGVQLAKYGATVLMFLTGLRRLLMGRRFAPLSPERTDHYQDELAMIKQMPLLPHGA